MKPRTKHIYIWYMYTKPSPACLSLWVYISVCILQSNYTSFFQRRLTMSLLGGTQVTATEIESPVPSPVQFAALQEVSKQNQQSEILQALANHCRSGPLLLVRRRCTSTSTTTTTTAVPDRHQKENRWWVGLINELKAVVHAFFFFFFDFS